MNKMTELKNKMFNNFSNFAADKAIELTDKSFSKCAFLVFYEPKLPEELLNSIETK